MRPGFEHVGRIDEAAAGGLVIIQTEFVLWLNPCTPGISRNVGPVHVDVDPVCVF